MKKIMIPLAAIALVGLYAGTASAQCHFDAVNAKGVSGSMVRNFAACGSTQLPAVDTETEGNTPACANPVPQAAEGDSTLYSFGPKGGCSVKVQSKLEKDCSKFLSEAGPCHVAFVSGKCGGILGTDGVTPIGEDDDGWALATLTRATFDDKTFGDMTVIDFPVTFQFGVPSKGKLSLKSNSIEALTPLVGANNADLPQCTILQIVDLTIKDADGLPFAKLGGSTVPLGGSTAP